MFSSGVNHFVDCDEQLGAIPGICPAEREEEFPLLVRGVDLANLAYSFDKLCKILPNTTMLEVFNIEARFLGDLGGQASQIAGFAKNAFSGEESKKLTTKGPQPDVLAFFDSTCNYEPDGKPTIWVVCRGSVTTTDFLGDVMWLNNANFVGNLQIPELPTSRANFCLRKLVAFIDKVKRESPIVPKRICFTGHSLGGAVAGCLFLKYHMFVPPSQQLSARLISLGCPQMFPRDMPDVLTWGPGAHTVVVHELGRKIYNGSQRMDLVPRMAGPHELPDVLLEFPGIGQLVQTFVEQMKQNEATPDGRQSFQCFGHFYSLNPAHEDRQDAMFSRVPDGIDLLAVFPKVASNFLKAVKDHSSSESAETMLNLFPAYFGKFRCEDSEKPEFKKEDFPKAHLRFVDNHLEVPEKFAEHDVESYTGQAFAAGAAIAGGAAGLGAAGANAAFGRMSEMMSGDGGGGGGRGHTPNGSALKISASDLYCRSGFLCCICGYFFNMPECLGWSGSGGCMGCCEEGENAITFMHKHTHTDTYRYTYTHK